MDGEVGGRRGADDDEARGRGPLTAVSGQADTDVSDRVAEVAIAGGVLRIDHRDATPSGVIAEFLLTVLGLLDITSTHCTDTTEANRVK